MLIAKGYFIVLTANAIATDYGLKILAATGTAMDAVATSQTVLSVVEPQSSWFGGGGFLLYWNQDQKRLHALDGREMSPEK